MSPKGRDILKSMVGSTDTGTPESPNAAHTHRPSGAVKAMNLSLGRLGEEAAAAKALRESISSGDKVVELDVALIDMSFIRDRIPMEQDVDFEALKQSILESGQQVPILVRPIADKPGRYQAAYGHRRLRAMAEIGMPIKAIVRKLSDEELVLAQGQENGARLDLSFIERALFARRMEEHGFDRATISKALTTDKPETSRLLQVAQTVDPEIILAVGPAPKVGRPRWLALAEKLRDAPSVRKARSAATETGFSALDSNKRFERIWKALEPKPEAAKGEGEALRTRKGLLVASISTSGRNTKITVKSPAFSEFLTQRLAVLVAEFEAENEDKRSN